MEYAHLMIFLCLAAPLSMMLFVFKKQSFTVLLFLISGLFMCLFAGEVNGLLLAQLDLPLYSLTTNVTPIVEEVLKALPIVFMAFVFKPDKRLLLECALAIGVGFATMENACLLFDYAKELSAAMILARGFGSGMMHGICTLAVGYSMTFVSAQKKISFTGTVAALSAAIIYHSIYNIIVQSAHPLLGILLPTASFIPLLAASRRVRTNE